MAEYPITPCPKPRMTQRDKAAVCRIKGMRPAVVRYNAFKDEVRLRRVKVPESGCTVVFGLPMPPSWSKKKRKEMDGKPHQQVPDVDNMLKALLDAIYENDCGVWDIRAVKRWSVDGFIEISV